MINSKGRNKVTGIEEIKFDWEKAARDRAHGSTFWMIVRNDDVCGVGPRSEPFRTPELRDHLAWGLVAGPTDYCVNFDSSKATWSKIDSFLKKHGFEYDHPLGNPGIRQSKHDWTKIGLAIPERYKSLELGIRYAKFFCSVTEELRDRDWKTEWRKPVIFKGLPEGRRAALEEKAIEFSQLEDGRIEVSKLESLKNLKRLCDLCNTRIAELEGACRKAC